MGISWEEYAGEDPRTGEQSPDQRFKLYRLCECPACRGTGKTKKKSSRHVVEGDPTYTQPKRCPDCRGEGKIRDLVATCSEGALGDTIIRLGREGEFTDCPFGLLDTMGEPDQKWLIKPWLPSARNVSDAGRTLSHARKRA